MIHFRVKWVILSFILWPMWLSSFYSRSTASRRVFISLCSISSYVSLFCSYWLSLISCRLSLALKKMLGSLGSILSSAALCLRSSGRSLFLSVCMSAMSLSQQLRACRICLAWERVMGWARCMHISRCSFSSTWLMSSRCLMRFSMSTGSSCSQISSRILERSSMMGKQSGAMPKVSSQPQREQARQVWKPKSSSFTFLPFSSRVSRDCATYISQLMSLQEERKKTMAVKMSPKSPPTQERTASILPMVLEMLKLLVDLQMLRLTQRVEEIETEFVWKPYTQLPVREEQAVVGQQLSSVCRVYWAMLMQPTVPMVLVKAMKMFFSMTLVMAWSLEAVMMVSTMKKRTLKQSLEARQSVMKVEMLLAESHSLSMVSLHWTISKVRYLQIGEPTQPASATLYWLSMHSILSKPKARNCLSKFCPNYCQSEYWQGDSMMFLFWVTGGEEEVAISSTWLRKKRNCLGVAERSTPSTETANFMSARELSLEMSSESPWAQVMVSLPNICVSWMQRMAAKENMMAKERSPPMMVQNWVYLRARKVGVALSMSMRRIVLRMNYRSFIGMFDVVNLLSIGGLLHRQCEIILLCRGNNRGSLGEGGWGIQGGVGIMGDFWLLGDVVVCLGGIYYVLAFWVERFLIRLLVLKEICIEQDGEVEVESIYIDEKTLLLWGWDLF